MTNLLNIVAAGNEDTPFSTNLARFFTTAFPNNSAVNDKAALIEILTDVIIGTRRVRMGGAPSPPSRQVIRETIGNAVLFQKPVPILVPFGGIKGDITSRIDIAEVCALKTLGCLNERVKAFYPHGLEIVVRVEDTGAAWLYRELDGFTATRPSVNVLINNYARSLSYLNDILGYNDFITIKVESELMSETRYFELAADYAEQFLIYLRDTELGVSNSKKALEAIGWRGAITQAQRDYYYSRYNAQRGGLVNDDDNRRKLADYFAGALVRYELDGRADKKSWSGVFLNLSFVPPVPDAPDTLNYLYYRTMPADYTRDSIPAWRGKGYLRLDQNGEATPAVASFRSLATFSPFGFVLSCEIGLETRSVYVQSDFLVLDRFDKAV